MSKRCRRVASYCRRSRNAKRPCTRDGVAGTVVSAHWRPKGCDVAAATTIQAAARGRLERKACPMRPFVPTECRFHVWHARDVETRVDDYEREYAYKERSRQDRFFDADRAWRGTPEVAVLYTGAAAPPRHLASARVVARVFGVRETSGSFTIWHASVRKAHPLNASGRGTRWGVCNTIRFDGRRWHGASGTLTQRRAEAEVAGTPNPYLCECLARYGAARKCEAMGQDPEAPCAQLFSAASSNHRSHPAVLLLYLSMGFVRARGLTHYVRFDTSPPLAGCHARLLARMRRGLPAHV